MSTQPMMFWLEKDTCTKILNSHKKGKATTMANALQIDWNFKERQFTIRLIGSPYSDLCEIWCLWNFLNGDHFKFRSEEQLEVFLNTDQKI